MKTSCVVAVLLLLIGCATALKREGQCLASLTPEFLSAQEELAQLEASWRQLLRTTNTDFVSPFALLTPLPESLRGSAPSAASGGHLSERDRMDRQRHAHRAVAEAYGKLTEARVRHQPTRGWYDKVYERVRTRMEEEEILSDVRLVLMTSPALIFYPIIRWNIHSVIWDDTDPDAESDPVTQYCTDRLSKVAVSADPLIGVSAK